MLLLGDWAPGDQPVRLNLNAGLCLANLEGPILPQGHSLPPAPKVGPHLSAAALPDAFSDFAFSLANNHIMDFGAEGLRITRQALQARGMSACGAGLDLAEARQPLILQDGAARVAVISCCETQFGIALPSRPGAAEFGPWVYQSIRTLKSEVDAVIVSVHAALEDSPWPSPYLRGVFRSYIEAGADVVHGHHAHTPRSWESHGDGMIFYGLGNFAVAPERWRNSPNGLWSLGVELDFSVRPFRWQPLTLEIRSNAADGILVEKSSAVETEERNAYLDECNLPLKNPSLHESLWQEVAVRAFNRYGQDYIRHLPHARASVLARLRRVLVNFKHHFLRRGRILPPGQAELMLWYHMIACESHRQMLVTALGVLSGEIPDLRTAETRRLADKLLPY